MKRERKERAVKEARQRQRLGASEERQEEEHGGNAAGLGSSRTFREEHWGGWEQDLL